MKTFLITAILALASQSFATVKYNCSGSDTNTKKAYTLQISTGYSHAGSFANVDLTDVASGKTEKLFGMGTSAAIPLDESVSFNAFISESSISIYSMPAGELKLITSDIVKCPRCAGLETYQLVHGELKNENVSIPFACNKN